MIRTSHHLIPQPAVPTGARGSEGGRFDHIGGIIDYGMNPRQPTDGLVSSSPSGPFLRKHGLDAKTFLVIYTTLHAHVSEATILPSRFSRWELEAGWNCGINLFVLSVLIFLLVDLKVLSKTSMFACCSHGFIACKPSETPRHWSFRAVPFSLAFPCFFL